MATRTVDYYVVNVPQRPGKGAELLSKLREQGVNLLAVHAFPAGSGAQVDLVPESGAALARAARTAGLKLGRPKKAFLVEGGDRVGALVPVLSKLGRAGINVRATTAVRAGKRRYGAIFWVRSADVRKAARVLGARAK